jgi:hypothetical protein
MFESFSQEDWQNKVLNASNLLDILYDLKEISLEYLDVRHVSDNRFNSDDPEDYNVMDKKIIFIVDLHSKENLFEGNLLGGEYSFESPEIEENLYWSNEIKIPVNEIVDGFKSGYFSLNITFCIVVGDEGNLVIVNKDTSEVYKTISEMYPEVEFDTFNPWDIN